MISELFRKEIKSKGKMLRDGSIDALLEKSPRENWTKKDKEKLMLSITCRTLALFITLNPFSKLKSYLSLCVTSLLKVGVKTQILYSIMDLSQTKL